MAKVSATVDLVGLASAPSQTERDNAARTHRIIRQHLESDPALDRYRIDTYLQGSYANSTNVRGDSDVDIGSLTSQVYYPDTIELPTTSPAPGVKSQLELYESESPEGEFGFWDYRQDVLNSLRKEFGETIIDGNKAITVLGNSSRLDADILPCCQFRYYWRYTVYEQRYEAGICFFSKSARQKQIVNFPKQHSDNLTNKNTATREKLKGCIRILKRLRNALCDRRQWDRKRSPSYYLECLLWNVPNHIFLGEYQYVFPEVLKYLVLDLDEKRECGDLNSYMQANDILYLFHSDSWKVEDAIAFLLKVLSSISTR